jgi:hypothetical protein
LDNIYNHVINDNNIQDSYQIWQELQSGYAASTVLVIFRPWLRWEDVQYKGSMLQNIKDMELVLAKVSAMGLDKPSKLISLYGIIARVTKKRPALMEMLLKRPNQPIAKLRDIGNHNKATVPQAAAWAVLATQAYTPHHCGNHTQG